MLNESKQNIHIPIYIYCKLTTLNVIYNTIVKQKLQLASFNWIRCTLMDR